MDRMNSVIGWDQALQVVEARRSEKWRSAYCAFIAEQIKVNTKGGGGASLHMPDPERMKAKNCMIVMARTGQLIIAACHVEPLDGHVYKIRGLAKVFFAHRLAPRLVIAKAVQETALRDPLATFEAYARTFPAAWHGSIGASNKASINLFKELGFVEDGIVTNTWAADQADGHLKDSLDDGVTYGAIRLRSTSETLPTADALLRP